MKNKDNEPVLTGNTLTTDQTESEECYIVITGSFISSGPRVNAPKEELEEFFAGIKKFNEEQGKEVARFYDPTKLSPVTDKDIPWD